MSLEDADEILKEDIDILEGIIFRVEKSKFKDINLLLQAAQKSNDIADLYYAAMDDFNERYYQYKLKSCLFYENISKATDNHNIRMNTRFLSILLYFQAKKPETARKKIQILKKKQKIKKGDEIDENLFLILDLFSEGNLSKAKKALRVNKSIIDEDLYNFFQKTLDILFEMKEKT
jgi:hypothetical protein